MKTVLSEQSKVFMVDGEFAGQLGTILFISETKPPFFSVEVEDKSVLLCTGQRFIPLWPVLLSITSLFFRK